MRKLAMFLSLGLGLAGIALPSFAAEHNNGGLGFRSTSAPVGIRWWMSGQKVAIDAGLGFASQDAGDETLTRFTIDAGVPLVWKSWDQVHAMFRPGIMFTSQDQLIPDPDGPGVEKDSATSLSIMAEIETEVFLASNVSMSGAFGLAITNNSPAGEGDSATNFGLTGDNFAHLGFHVYLFGGE